MLNEAISVYMACGFSAALFGQHDGKRNVKHTKSGPGRRHADGDGVKTDKQKRAGAYGRGLRNWRSGKLSKGRI